MPNICTAPPPPRLAELERWLARAICEPALTAHEAFRREVAERLRPEPPERAIDRLGAHIGGYPARLAEALREAYPAVAHLAGERRFAELVERYRRYVPDGVYNLSEVGRNLPALLEEDPVGKELPFLRDLARMEWAAHLSFHAALEPPFDAREHADWPLDRWQRARLTFQPSVVLVRSSWPILDLWRARHTPLEEIDLVVEGRPQNVLVYRVEWKIACDELSRDEADLLDHLLAGVTLGEALSALAARSGVASSVGEWLATWAARGLITAIESVESQD